MPNQTPVLRWVVPLAVLLLTGCAGKPRLGGGSNTLRGALKFYASFDRGTDAEFATADPWLYHAPALEEWKDAVPGLPGPDLVRVAPQEGRFGGALQFIEPGDPVVFYRAGGNVPWAASDWGGTISFWLRTDLDALPPGFCDPVQVTSQGWNDAALFVEFERRARETPFRLGAYADYEVWNPLNREWSDIPPAERPLLTVSGPPFSADRWTHVAFAWEHFNTGKPDAVTTLYLDGAPVGAIRGRTQTFTWDPKDARLLLGVGFVGWIDELAAFDRALTREEIQRVRLLPRGIRSLLQP